MKLSDTSIKMKSCKITPQLTRKFLREIRSLTAATVVVIAYNQGHSAEIVKANNIDDISSTTSWIGGVLPGVDDTVLFDATLDSGLSMPFTGTASWKGLRVVNNVGNLTVSTTGTAPTITLGVDGIDFSLATAGTEIAFDSASLVAQIGKTQKWKIGDGVTSTLWGNFTSANSEVVFDKLGSGTGSFVAEGFGTVGVIMPYALMRVGSSLNFATVEASRAIVAADTLAVANPTDGGVPTAAAVLAGWPATGYIDVTNSNGLATSTAFQVNASLFPSAASGIRFNQPHSTPGTPWVVGFGGSGRFQPGFPVSILVTPNVGANNVIFANGSGAHEFRFNNANGRLIFQQFNTAADLIWRGDISSAVSNAATTVTKTGPGRLIMANPSFAPSISTVYITEGILQLGEGNATGTFNNEPIVNNGSLVFNRSGSFSHAGIISGTGSVVFNTVTGGDVTLSGLNTYSGATTLNSGTAILGSASAFGASSSITLAGGGLTYAAGVTTDLSLQAAVAITGNVALNLNANNVAYANSIGGGGAGSITKSGTGTLTFGGANTYTGNTTISAGGLKVINTSGSATGAGNVSLASATTLSGTGTISGNVSTSTGTTVVPGDSGVGTLTMGGLTLAPSSIVDIEFASASSYDKIVTTSSNGLTVNGGNFHLYTAGSTNPWLTEATYNLFQFSGTLQGTGPSSLSVLNPQAGYEYTFGATGGFVTLQIVKDAVISNWVSTGGGAWSSAANWFTPNGEPAVPTNGYTARFIANLASPATVTLDGNRTINGAVFTSSPNGYTIAQGTSGTLTFDKGVKNAAINVTSGTHVISAPVALASTIAVSTDASTSLTFSGIVSGNGGVTKTGPGVLDFTGHNTFTGSILATGGVLGFAHSDGLGSGTITLSGATLRYDAGNTADISSRSITVGQDGAGVDTNDNDVTFANPFGNSGIGAFTKLGLGSLTVANDNTYQGETFVSGGELMIAANSALGSPALAMPLHLSGGLLVPTASITLDNAGANPRPVLVDAAGGGFLTATGVTLTVNGTMSGTGMLTKAGAGDLILTANNSTFTGPVRIEAGNVRLGASQPIGQTGLGTGTITFAGNSQLYLNSAGLPDNAAGFGNLTNNIVVPSGVVADLFAPTRGALSGAVSGLATVVGETTTYPSGTLNLHVDFTRFDITGNWPNFTGVLNVHKTPTGDGTDIDQYRMVAAQNLIAAKVHLNAGVQMEQTFNPPNNAIGTIHSFGELTADVGSFLAGNTVPGRFNIYSVGALNTDFAINGQFRGTLNTFGGYGYPGLNKVGTGTLTLNQSHMMTGPINVNAGTLKVDGAIERFYLGIGLDGIFGQPTPGTTGDDTISITPPATDFQNVEPGPLVVAAGATLAGTGRLGGAVTINGNLRPDVTASAGGQLSFTGASVLTLGATATTTFDFGGTAFTGVKSTVTSGVTYGGALKLNFLNTIYNGSYTLFELTGAPIGAFAGVTVTTTTTTDAALTDTAGTWTGTVDGASFSFDSATGVLTVTGGATAVLPDTPAGVIATGGNAQVSLSWNASSGASNYLVKRSTIAGGTYTTVTNAVVTTSYVDTGLTNGTTYYYVIQAKNAAGFSGNSSEVSATPIPSTITGLQNWRQENFGTTENTGNAADNADPDADGIPNLLEYATNRDPNAANSTPVLEIGKSGSGLRLTVTFTSIDDDNLVYTVQGVNDIAGVPAWAEVDTLTGAENIAGAVTVTDTQDISASARRFLRLTVSYTTP